jgi:hypothetical protein
MTLACTECRVTCRLLAVMYIQDCLFRAAHNCTQLMTEGGGVQHESRPAVMADACMQGYLPGRCVCKGTCQDGVCASQVQGKGGEPSTTWAAVRPAVCWLCRLSIRWLAHGRSGMPCYGQGRSPVLGTAWKECVQDLCAGFVWVPRGAARGAAQASVRVVQVVATDECCSGSAFGMQVPTPGLL